MKNHILKHILLFLSLVVGVFYASISLAAETILAPTTMQAPPTYQVEIIIFSYQQPINTDNEQFPTNSHFIMPDDAISPVDPDQINASNDSTAMQIDSNDDDTPPSNTDTNNVDTANSLPTQPTTEPSTQTTPITLVSPNHYKLNRTAQRIASNPNDHILLHTAWLQPIQATPLTIALPSPNSTSNPDDPDLNTTPLIGWITLSKHKYIDISTSLLLLEQSENALGFLSSGQSNQSFLLKQKRHMRTKELNYFDHPRFGMLIEIFKHA